MIPVRKTAPVRKKTRPGRRVRPESVPERSADPKAPVIGLSLPTADPRGDRATSTPLRSWGCVAPPSDDEPQKTDRRLDPDRDRGRGVEPVKPAGSLHASPPARAFHSDADGR